MIEDTRQEKEPTEMTELGHRVLDDNGEEFESACIEEVTEARELAKALSCEASVEHEVNQDCVIEIVEFNKDEDRRYFTPLEKVTYNFESKLWTTERLTTDTYGE